MSKDIEKLAVFDFDQTLMDTPTKEEGTVIWKEKTGEEWPHKGWWGRAESLNMNIFDIGPIPSVEQDYKKEYNESRSVVVMMTGRHTGIKDEVTHILDQHGFDFDHYLFKKKSPTIEDKFEKLEWLLEKYPNVKYVDIWEDREEHVQHFKRWGENKEQVVNVNHVK